MQQSMKNMAGNDDCEWPNCIEHLDDMVCELTNWLQLEECLNNDHLGSKEKW